MKNGQGIEKSKSSTLNNKNQKNQVDADENAQIDLSEIPEWTDEMFAPESCGLSIPNYVDSKSQTCGLYIFVNIRAILISFQG